MMVFPLFPAWLRVTVDGGTNKWHTFVKQNTFDDLKFPDLITGDLDSANPAVVEQFVLMGSEIVPTPNQDETDFTKALKEVKKYSASNYLCACEPHNIIPSCLKLVFYFFFRKS